MSLRFNFLPADVESRLCTVQYCTVLYLRRTHADRKSGALERDGLWVEGAIASTVVLKPFFFL